MRKNYGGGTSIQSTRAPVKARRRAALRTIELFLHFAAQRLIILIMCATRPALTRCGTYACAFGRVLRGASTMRAHVYSGVAVGNSGGLVREREVWMRDAYVLCRCSALLAACCLRLVVSLLRRCCGVVSGLVGTLLR